MGKRIEGEGKAKGVTVNPTLCDTYIRSLVPVAAGNRFYPIKDYKGLNIQVTPNGVKSYIYRYRIDGIQKIYTFGQYPQLTPVQVSKEYHIVAGKAKSGVDPNNEKKEAKRLAQKQETSTQKVNDCLDLYVAEYVEKETKKSSKDETIRLIDKFIRPEIGLMDVHDVNPSNISSMIDKLLKTPTQANHVKAAASKFFNWTILKGYRDVGTNPVTVVPRKKTLGQRSSRLSEYNVSQLGEALSKSKEYKPALDAIVIYLLTGMRKSELIGDKKREIDGLTWDRVDFENNTITVYTKSRKGKTQTRLILCADITMKLLKNIKQIDGNPFVITGRIKNSSLVGIQDIWERVRLESKFVKSIGQDDVNYTIHDLRRTYAGIAKDLGHKTNVGDLLGHGVANVTEIYTRSEIDRLFEVVEHISTHIYGLLSGEVKPHRRNGK